jgi:hypothetical protein
MRLLEITFPGEEVAAFQLCSTCCKALGANKVPTLLQSNGFKYPSKLVYITMSCVTSVDGLYLTNTRVYHCYRITAPAVKEIKDEYARMNKHGLPMLAKQVSHFCRQVTSSKVTEIMPDVQSLHLRNREHGIDNLRQLFLSLPRSMRRVWWHTLMT